MSAPEKTPEKIYAEVLNGNLTKRWTPDNEDSSDVLYVRGDVYEALKAESARLRQHLADLHHLAR